MIRIPQVRVVDEEGAQLGVMATPQALEMAQERGLDLVEVAPMASPPVVKFLDFGQYKYELTKRDKEAKRKQRSVTFKEVRLKPKIGVGDFDTKVRRAIQFLEEGDRIKVAVQFRGRELTHPEIGRALLARFSEQIKDHGAVERSPLLEGKSMHITVASTHKPKVIEHISKHPTELTEDEAAAPATAEVVATSPTKAAPAAPVVSAEGPAVPAEAPAPADAAAAMVAVAPAPAEAATETASAAAAEAAAPIVAEAPASAPAVAPAPSATPAPAAAKAAAPTAPSVPAAPKAPRAKAAPKATISTTGAAAAETPRPAPRPARTRKTPEPGAPAPASAGE